MSGTITMTGEEYDALRAEAEALRAENAELRAALTEQGERQEASPDVRGLVEALEIAFPLLDDVGLSETLHHCEWAIQQERKRLHRILAAHHQTQQGDSNDT